MTVKTYFGLFVLVLSVGLRSVIGSFGLEASLTVIDYDEASLCGVEKRGRGGLGRHNHRVGIAATILTKEEEGGNFFFHCSDLRELPT